MSKSTYFCFVNTFQATVKKYKVSLDHFIMESELEYRSPALEFSYMEFNYKEIKHVHGEEMDTVT